MIITLDNLRVLLEEMKKVYGDLELSNITREALETYILNIDYDELKFDTGQTLTGGASSGVLGIGTLGLMVLGSS